MSRGRLLSAEELGGLFTHLGYEWDPRSITKTIDYYQTRTTGSSTLNAPVDAAVPARDTLRLNPSGPSAWARWNSPFFYRDHVRVLSIIGQTIRVRSINGKAAPVRVARQAAS
jgi:trehalose/maltose hydrolase-like predicted phosphorylase